MGAKGWILVYVEYLREWMMAKYRSSVTAKRCDTVETDVNFKNWSDAMQTGSSRMTLHEMYKGILRLPVTRSDKARLHSSRLVTVRSDFRRSTRAMTYAFTMVTRTARQIGGMSYFGLKTPIQCWLLSCAAAKFSVVSFLCGRVENEEFWILLLLLVVISVWSHLLWPALNRESVRLVTTPTLHSERRTTTPIKKAELTHNYELDKTIAGEYGYQNP